MVPPRSLCQLQAQLARPRRSQERSRCLLAGAEPKGAGPHSHTVSRLRPDFSYCTMDFVNLLFVICTCRCAPVPTQSNRIRVF